MSKLHYNPGSFALAVASLTAAIRVASLLVAEHSETQRCDKLISAWEKVAERAIEKGIAPLALVGCNPPSVPKG